MPPAPLDGAPLPAGWRGDRREAFATQLRAALHDQSPDGTFTEVAELVALLARRPE